MNKQANRLIHSKSPYLLQHAYNPVDWYAWGEHAFQKATDENKLVLVSIGYSACHWCHVMEHEVFENEEAAVYMNEHFVCIKVDREERPDVDHLYMDAIHLMGQNGGWPLNVFVLPDGRPIFGGTYFPKQRWMGTLENLVRLQQDEPEKVEEYAKALERGLFQLENISKAGATKPDKSKHITQVIEWMNYWDFEKGGSRKAPKFPMPSHLDLALHYGTLFKDNDALEYYYTTLDKMALGGIYDQVGGGFARYSVDDIWKVPHFEKMLYDNGQLISTYSNAYKASKNPMYARIVQETIDFIQTNWLSQSGLIYCASDADSEGIEGKFYVWNLEDLTSILGEDFEFAENLFHLDSIGFWEHGNYILMRKNNDIEVAHELQISIEELTEKINRINVRLNEIREQRIHPGIDTKSLTSWNAIYIKSLCDASEALGQSSYLNIAESVFKNLVEQHYSKEFGWLRLQNERERQHAFLEDYSTVIEASIHLYLATANISYIENAEEWIKEALQRFGDKDKSLLWFSKRDPLIISRKKEVVDNVIPASNSIFAKCLFLVSRILGKSEYEERAVRMLNEVRPQIDFVGSYTNWLMLEEWLIGPFREVAITGSDALGMRSQLASGYLPNTVIAASTTDSSLPLFADRFGTITAAYVCKDKTCSLPIQKLEEVQKELTL
jgi:uncharacterized protein YyaL (SSP411 family)